MLSGSVLGTLTGNFWERIGGKGVPGLFVRSRRTPRVSCASKTFCQRIGRRL